jgi:hypothetical protein
MTIRVTVTDLESGDTETQEITDDVLVIVEGRCQVGGVQSYANGTQVWTIKNAGGRS